MPTFVDHRGSITGRAQELAGMIGNLREQAARTTTPRQAAFRAAVALHAIAAGCAYLAELVRWYALPDLKREQIPQPRYGPAAGPTGEPDDLLHDAADAAQDGTLALLESVQAVGCPIDALGSRIAADLWQHVVTTGLLTKHLAEARDRHQQYLDLVEQAHVRQVEFHESH